MGPLLGTLGHNKEKDEHGPVHGLILVKKERQGAKSIPQSVCVKS